MITLQDGQQYITRGGRRVRVEYRCNASQSMYQFWATDVVTGERWTCTRLGKQYRDRRSTRDIESKVDMTKTSEGDSNVDTSNLKNLKTESDKARQTYLESLKALQDSLPEGVKLMVEGEEFDGTNTGVSETEELVEINQKRDVKVGDILRLVGDVDRGHSKYDVVEKGQDYRVVNIDGCNDPHIVICNGSSTRSIDTCGILRQFVIVRNSVHDTSGTWVVLSRDNRHMIGTGSVVRATGLGARDMPRLLTEGREYRITSKPDGDGRFRDDRNEVRDTCSFYDGELELKIS